MRKHFILLMGVLILGAGSVWAQPRTVTGVVTTSEDGSPLVQLTVLVKGTTTGVVTGADGRYSIGVAGPEAVLVFKYTGYETQEILVAEQSTIDVVMVESLEEIESVVCLGYGTERKIANAVGKVSSVDSKKLEHRPVANVMDALQSQVAGLSVLNSGGEPAVLSSIRLHGTGSLGASSAPLYVIDGQPASATTVMGMNQNDFQSITVLTDASATSIYGARAANGVIYITTKKGKKGEDGRITVRGMYGWSSLASTDYFENMMTTEELFNFHKEIGYADQEYIDSMIRTHGLGTTRWYKEVYNSHAPTYSGDLTFSGANERVAYYLSAGYFRADGLRFFSGYERYSVRANVSSEVYSWLSAGINSNVSYDKSQTNGEWVYRYIAQELPYISPYDKNGERIYGLVPETFGFYSVDYQKDKQREDEGTLNVTTQGWVQLNPIKGLTLRSQAGVEGWIQRYAYSMLPSDDRRYNRKRGMGLGYSTESNSRGTTYSVTNTAEYKLNFLEDHNITLLAGHEYIYNNWKSADMSNSGQRDDRLLLVQFGGDPGIPGDPNNKADPNRWMDMSQGLSEYDFLSFFGRAEYNFKERYFVDLSLRNDKSSRFGRDRRNAQFWSAGLMWKAKREDFLMPLNWLDDLNLKFSVGTSGNSGIGNYDALAMTAVTSGKYGGKSGYTISNPGNPALTWENQLLTTVSLDFSLFQILRMDVSYYYRLTTDMLMDIPLPWTTGYDYHTKNIGELSNQGVDLRVEVTAYRSSKGDHVTPYITFNYNKEKIMKVFGDKGFYEIPNTGVTYVEGRPVEIWYPLFAGIDPEDGYPTWYEPDEDRTRPRRDPDHVSKGDGSGAPPSGFTQSTGKPLNAPINGGFGLSASYWGFYVNADFVFTLGKWMISNDRYFDENPWIFAPNNQNRELIGNYWKEAGDQAKYPGTHVYTWTTFDDRIVENSSFMRMKNLTVGYSVPRRWLKHTKLLSSVKLYCALRNFLTVTKYTGLDPETRSNLAFGQNPNTKQVSFGLEIQF